MSFASVRIHKTVLAYVSLYLLLAQLADLLRFGMGKLLELAQALSSRESGSRGLANVREVEQEFVETITFASADEIISVLRTGLDEDWMALLH
jgi:hypothetical protein